MQVCFRVWTDIMMVRNVDDGRLWLTRASPSWEVS